MHAPLMTHIVKTTLNDKKHMPQEQNTLFQLKGMLMANGITNAMIT